MLVPILITCAQFALTGDADALVARIGAPAPAAAVQPLGLLLEDDGESDLALSLYKNAFTREIVIEFYESIARSGDITRAVLEAAAKYSIPPSLAFALCGVESRFNSRALNANAVSIDRGLFQLNSLSFPEFTEADFFSIQKNAEHGMKYLRYCLDRGENDVVALAMYNAGEGRVSGPGTPLTTLTYISRILDLKIELEARFREKVLARLSS